LADLTTLPGQNQAVATVLHPNMTDSYAVHPTTIDQCLQLFAIASSNGLTRQLNKLYVPVSKRFLDLVNFSTSPYVVV
jgi:hypothetical protein